MTKHLRFLFVMLLAMIWSAGWAAETVYKTLSFPDEKKENCNSYTTTWDATIGNDSWKIANFNNNNWGWNWIKCGSKKAASTATITNSTAFDQPITKVVVNASAIKNVDKIKTVKLESSKESNFASVSETVTLDLKTLKPGDLTFELKTPIENGYYKLTFDCLKTSSNGIIQVDKVDYYINDSKTSTTLEFPQDAFTFATTDNYSSFTGQTATLIADGAELTGKTIAYSKSGDDIFSSFNESDGTLALNGNLGTATVTANFDGSNDETYASSSASYTITVNKLYSTIASFKQDIPSTANAIDKALPFCLKLTDAIVTYVNDKKAYLQDATSGVLIYGDNALDLKAGEKYTGIVNVSACLFNGMAEITAWNAASDIVKEENVDIPVVSVTLEQLNGNDYSKYECVRVKVENATVSTGYTSAKKATIAQGEQKYLIHGEVNGLKVTKDDLCDFVGYPIYWKTLDEHQLSVWSQDDIIVKPVVLDESADNTIAKKTSADVTLKRPMNVGQWNTFCVPFSIDAKQIASQFGEGTQIAKFVDSIDDEIQFTTLTSNEIVAGEPYLVKPINAADSYSFTNVSVAATDPITKGGGEYISFKGIYNPTDITVGLPANTFAAGIVGNVVKKAVSGSNMKGFRAFFIIPEGTGAQSSYMLKIDGTVTSINSINGADVVVNAPVYNLQGQRVDGNNLTPGIYVKAGKKFVVK
ncbi:hypothetical protein [Prevotella merdae]|uniref:hypothetical protein n=1 Tax=Prevotella merdae TaxID=2079531 RepID=UPI003F817E3F